MNLEQYQKLREDGHFQAMWIDLLNASGFAGVLSNGNIVDRRYFPEAIPVAKNSLFGVAEPKEISNQENSESEKIIEIRKAFADYYTSKGCSCCQNIEDHQNAEMKLGQLLEAKPYDDGSSFNWSLYNSDN